MPNIFIPNQENDQSVIRPIVRQLADSIRQITRMGDIPLFIPNDQGNLIQLNSKLSDTPTLGTLTSDTRLFITADVKQNEELLNTNAVYSEEHPAVFIDRDLKFVIRPVYVKTDITLTIKYISNSKTDALRWLNDTYVRLVTHEDFNLHTFSYHFPLSKSLLVLIEQIHRQREAIAGYGESLEHYLIHKATSRLNVVSEITGSLPTLVFNESQTRIIGLYENYPLQQKPEYDKQAGTYSVEIPYKVTFDNPTGFTARYPIVVHNQLLPEDFIPNKRVVLDHVENGYFSRSLAAVNRFELQNQLSKIPIAEELILPQEDDFRPSHITPGMVGYMQTLCTAEDDNVLLDITELDDHYVDQDLMQFIIAERDYAFKQYKSIVHIAYYRDETLMRGTTLQMDDGGVVSSTEPLNYRSTYRLKFCILVDLELLDPAALDRLKRYPLVLMKILAVFNGLVNKYPGLVTLSNKKQLTGSDVNNIYEWLVERSDNRSDNGIVDQDTSKDGSSSGNKTYNGKLYQLLRYVFNGQVSTMKTVMTTYTQAHRRI